MQRKYASTPRSHVLQGQMIITALCCYPAREDIKSINRETADPVERKSGHYAPGRGIINPCSFNPERRSQCERNSKRSCSFNRERRSQCLWKSQHSTLFQSGTPEPMVDQLLLAHCHNQNTNVIDLAAGVTLLGMSPLRLLREWPIPISVAHLLGFSNDVPRHNGTHIPTLALRTQRLLTELGAHDDLPSRTPNPAPHSENGFARDAQDVGLPQVIPQAISREDEEVAMLQLPPGNRGVHRVVDERSRPAEQSLLSLNVARDFGQLEGGVPGVRLVLGDVVQAERRNMGVAAVAKVCDLQFSRRGGDADACGASASGDAGVVEDCVVGDFHEVLRAERVRGVGFSAEGIGVLLRSKRHVLTERVSEVGGIDAVVTPT